MSDGIKSKALTVPELLLARSRDSGGRVFCSFKGRNLTFGELLAGVQEMAGALAAAGVRTGSRVGYLAPPSLEHIQLYLAASWLGRAQSSSAST